MLCWIQSEHTELVGQAKPLCEVWDVHLTMRLDSLLITVNFQLAAHQQKTEQNVLLIWTLSHTTVIQTNARATLIALTRWQTKSTWEVVVQPIPQWSLASDAAAVYDGWVIYKAVFCQDLALSNSVCGATGRQVAIRNQKCHQYCLHLRR